ncbi:hypothetical protein [Phnomibacter sp. MR]|uniref:hypothetical protein n=1 Tax=Phnomibacter sp. MR TaxID=3042318 RepID=UPI003A811071
MNKHEQALYDYMSEPANFSTACEVAEKLPWLKRELIASFWNEMDGLLLERLALELPGWKTFKDDNLFEKHSKFGIYNEGWDFDKPDENPVGLCFESISGMDGKLFIGFAIDGNNKYYDLKAIHKAFEGTELQKRLTHHNDWWLFGKYLNPHFANNQTLMQILPATRGPLMQELMGMMITLAKELEAEVDVLALLSQSRL